MLLARLRRRQGSSGRNLSLGDLAIAIPASLVLSGLRVAKPGASTFMKLDVSWLITARNFALVVVAALLTGLGLLIDEVVEGDTLQFDQAVLMALREPVTLRTLSGQCGWRR